MSEKMSEKEQGKLKCAIWLNDHNLAIAQLGISAIAQRLFDEEGILLSEDVIRKLMINLGFAYKKGRRITIADRCDRIEKFLKNKLGYL